MRVSPYILGSGRAGQAIAKALTCLNIQNKLLAIDPAQFLNRNDNVESVLTAARLRGETVLFGIANPPGLHADASVIAPDLPRSHFAPRTFIGLFKTQWEDKIANV